MAGLVDSFAAGIGAGAASGLIGMPFAEHDRKMNFYYNELAAKNADERARAQFRDMYSLPAQMRLIKEAGMSPSILYGGNGSQGGSVGAQGAGGAGVQTAFAPIDPLAAAQIDLMKSEARKNNVEADVSEGKNDLGKQIIKNWIAKNLGQDLANDYQTVQNYIANATKDYEINKIFAEAEQAATKAQILVYDLVKSQIGAEIAEKTKNEAIKNAQLVNKELIAKAFEETELGKLHKKQQDYLQGQIEYYSEKALREWTELAIKDADQKSRAQWYKDMNDWWDGQIKNMSERLEHDIHYDWAKLIVGVINDGMSRVFDALLKLIPSFGGGGMPKIKGLSN